MRPTLPILLALAACSHPQEDVYLADMPPGPDLSAAVDLSASPDLTPACSPPSSPWDFGTKTTYYMGPMKDPLLTGYDPVSGAWRCTRDDLNPRPADPVLRMFEPNDEPSTSVALPIPLPMDPPPTYLGAAYEVCPDRSDPTRPDYDVFKFRLLAPSNIAAQIDFDVEYGDLDLALFRSDLTRVTADLRAGSNACIGELMLPAGTYYVVVRGALSGPAAPVCSAAMNRYRLRVASYSDAAYPGCP